MNGLQSSVIFFDLFLEFLHIHFGFQYVRFDGGSQFTNSLISCKSYGLDLIFIGDFI